MTRYLKISICLIITIIGITILTNSQTYSQSINTTIKTLTGTNKNNSEETIKKEPELFKEPLIIHNKTILYIGATEALEAKYRVLTIRSAIDDAINNAVEENISSIEAVVIPEKDTYSIQLASINIITVTELDTKVNKLEPLKLAYKWKSNIDSIISDYTKRVENKPAPEPLKETGIALIILLLVIFIVDIFRIRVVKHLLQFSSTIIKKINEALLHINKDNKEETDDIKFEDKVNLITSELKTALNFITRGIQILAILIFINYSLFVFPVTNIYVKELTTFEISILLVIKETISFWLLSESTWQAIGKIIFIIIATIIVLWSLNIVFTVIEHLVEALLIRDTGREKRIQTLTNIVKTSIKIVIIALSITLILSGLGINITPIVAGAGIIGLAISFGAQSIVKDVINGFFILTENQFNIGDIVEIDNISGVVENMTLRSTVLRDISGRAHIIPNGQITKLTIYTKKWARANLDIAVSYKEDIDTAIKIIKETADQMHTEFPDKIIAEPEILGVNELTDSSVKIKLIMDTAPAQQWFVEREYRKRIKCAFDQNNISMPFPHRTIYVHNVKENH